MGILLRAGSKLIATVVIALALFIVSFMFWPKGILLLQDASEWFVDTVKAPGFLNDQAEVLYRTFINEGSILGIMVAAIARLLVEIVAFVFGGFGVRD